MSGEWCRHFSRRQADVAMLLCWAMSGCWYCLVLMHKSYKFRAGERILKTWLIMVGNELATFRVLMQNSYHLCRYHHCQIMAHKWSFLHKVLAGKDFAECCALVITKLAWISESESPMEQNPITFINSFLRKSLSELIGLVIYSLFLISLLLH